MKQSKDKLETFIMVDSIETLKLKDVCLGKFKIDEFRKILNSNKTDFIQDIIESYNNEHSPNVASLVFFKNGKGITQN